jgi:hypothetical protein
VKKVLLQLKKWFAKLVKFDKNIFSDALVDRVQTSQFQIKISNIAVEKKLEFSDC